MRHLDANTPVHATCVALDGRAVLILGKSGAGKSALGLLLMAFGATLVADDRVILTASDGLVATAPTAISGMIEARGVGLLNAKATPHARVVLAVDLDQSEPERLPAPRAISILDNIIPLQHGIEGLHLAASIMQYLRAGRRH